ncbi:MAG: hypothetical protein ABSG46_18845, partial [Candidatus Binataceae bacterium]
MPKADPNVFTVAIVPLENDADGEIENDIVEGLIDIKGIDVVQFHRPPISDRPVSSGSAIARGYLGQSHAQVLIWGAVLTLGETKVPKLYWTTSDDTSGAPESGHYPLAQVQNDITLPPSLIAQLDDLLRLLVVTQGTPFYGQEGQFIADKLAPFIKRVDNLLNGSSGQQWNAKDVAKIRLILADAQETLGKQNGQAQPLLDAINNYQLVLQRDTRASSPLEWAATEN